MNEFCLGQRVLCIDGAFHPSVWEYVNEVPIEGEVYTVRSIRLGGFDNVTRQPGPAIALEEISGSLPGCKKEICWIVRRFAPLDIQESNSAAKKKKSVAKKKRAPQPRRKKLEPALV